MSWTLIAILGLSAIAGVALHESCHWVVARALGRRPWFVVDLSDGVETVWEIESLEVRDYAALIAPQVLGGLLFVAAFVFQSWPLWAIPGWITLTLTGSRADWAPVLQALGYESSATAAN